MSVFFSKKTQQGVYAAEEAKEKAAYKQQVASATAVEDTNNVVKPCVRA